jgi:hypothetical protein
MFNGKRRIIVFKTAVRGQSKLRLALDGPSGSGKSYTALRFAHALANGGRIAAIDTERGSLSKYVGEAPDGVVWAFDVVELTTFSPERYTDLINQAGKAGYAVLIIDSLSHAWEGVGGALEIKDRQGGNNWAAWRAVTPIHNRMIDSILQSPMHVLTTMRSRMEYVQEIDPQTNKIAIRKVGMAPVQRPSIEYEWDVVCDLDWSHILTVSKSRCPAIADLKVEKPSQAFMDPVIDWLQSGAASKPAVSPMVSQLFEAVKPKYNLDELVTEFGVDAVLNLSGGVIPESDESIQVIGKLLHHEALVDG